MLVGSNDHTPALHFVKKLLNDYEYAKFGFSFENQIMCEWEND